MTKRERSALVAASIGTALLLLDVTVVYVALPAIGADLSAAFAEVQWVVDAYTVALAGTLLGAGVLADRLGRRRVFTCGVAVFTAASLLCALASSGLTLDLARAVQGLGAAAMFSASLALIAAEFQGAKRGRALGIWGAITGVALAVGPLVGGLVIEGLSWRWIFAINLPIGIFLIGYCLHSVPESRSQHARRLDLGGALLFALSCLLLVTGLTRGNEAGWGSPWIVLALAGSIVAVAAFVLVESRSTAPMLPLGLFRIPAFSATALVAFAQSIAIYPILIFIAIYLQNGLGYSALDAGLRLLPLTLLILAVAPIAGRMTARLELRVPLVAGLVLLGVALLLVRGVSVGDGWQALLPGMIVAGIAVGAISPSLAAAMVSVLPNEQSGMSSGINNTFRQLGIAVGVAGLGAIFEARQGSGDNQLTGIVDGLQSVAMVAALAALAAAAIAWPLMRGHRSSGG